MGRAPSRVWWVVLRGADQCLWGTPGYGANAQKSWRSSGRKDEGENDSRNHEGSDVGRGTGRASARGVRGRMRVGFRPSPAGGEEESREQGSADPERGEAKGRG